MTELERLEKEYENAKLKFWAARDAGYAARAAWKALEKAREEQAK